MVIKGLDTPQIIEAIRQGEFDGIRIQQLMRALDERLGMKEERAAA